MGGRLKIALLLAPALAVIGVLFAGGLGVASGNDPVVTSALALVFALVVALRFLQPAASGEGCGLLGPGKVS
ncbi:MAG: hypothetical protein M3R38_31060 [Actinomycetota bacterium]|nr:hypothetical protein [Actinomycetota bacterium]MDP9480055.1 hypothetical protein [Actinomycetota bacterium]MDP9484418.1 hypothetical protein [Actinomycetota bacterium]